MNWLGSCSAAFARRCEAAHSLWRAGIYKSVKVVFVGIESGMWMRLFRRRKQPDQQQVTAGRFELEQDGKTAYLEYTVAENILALIHTEVPKELRGRGLASELTQVALQWARDHHMKVDVICPSVAGFVEQHKEYSDLLLR